MLQWVGRGTVRFRMYSDVFHITLDMGYEEKSEKSRMIQRTLV